MAGSLAFWLEGKQEEEISGNLKAELHFNYWLLSDEKVNFLDIGILLSNHLDSISKICIYLPFPKADFEYNPSLGVTVTSNASLTSAVFNSSIKQTKPDANDSYCDYDFNNDTSLRFVKELPLKRTSNNIEKGILIDDLGPNKGCTICFPVEMFEICEDKNRSNYFRFRLKLKSNKIISTVNRSKGRIITTDFDEHELIDFRVNESRNLPNDISRKVANCKYLQKIHFFLIRDAYSDYKGAHSAYERCRLLERELWKEYLSPVELKNDVQMLIYHWKHTAENGIDHFAAFAKFSKRTVSKSDLLRIAFFIIILGLCVNFLSYCIPKGVHYLCDQLSSLFT